MLPPFDYFEHRRTCQTKQAQRAAKLTSLPSAYRGPLTPQDRSILSAPIADLVRRVHDKSLDPVEILHTYGKAAVKVQERTNCLTEVLFPEAEAWLTEDGGKGEEGKRGKVNRQGPLAGIPVSLKDSIAVGGWDVSVGYSRNCEKPYELDGSMVRLLKDAGAVPFVKTNLPITLLSFESTNDVWGRTTNPHNPEYSPGGSTGGEAALLAAGGSRIGIGSDVAGSVRVPAHWSGCYSLRCSTGRWPKMGMNTSMPGQEGIASVFSPMARTLDDLRYFTREFIKMGPWRYDHSVHPLEWRDKVEEEYQEKKVLRVGVMRTDGVVDPSPACARALQKVVDVLKAEGHETFDITPPEGASPYEGLVIASSLLNSDGCRTFASYFRTGEWMDRGAAQMLFYMRLPSPIRYLHYLWVKYVKRDELWAGLLHGFHEKSAFEQWKVVARREAFKAKWHDWWEGGAGRIAPEKGEAEKMDVLLTPPNATPAVPHGGMWEAVSSCGYTFLFNILDYTAGIIPVTHVDKELDQLPQDFSVRKLNGVAKGAYVHYNATKMHGLPVAVQVVGQRLQEEKVLAIMQRIEDALERDGGKYELLELD